jgi:hypothetical protein
LKKNVNFGFYIGKRSEQEPEHKPEPELELEKEPEPKKLTGSATLVNQVHEIIP